MPKSVYKSFRNIPLFLPIHSVIFCELGIYTYICFAFHNLGFYIVTFCNISLHSLNSGCAFCYVPLIRQVFYNCKQKHEGMSDINADDMLRYFIKTLSPSRSFPITIYYTESSYLGYIFIVYRILGNR